MAHPTRIMYLENKGGDVVEHWWGKESHESSLTGPARIGRVTFSKTGRSLMYEGKSFGRATGFKANYLCETGEWFWISGPKKNGQDSLYATNVPIVIDENVREEYWIHIRRQPERKAEKTT